MENRAHALATGAFILLLGLALVAVIAWFQGDRSERVGYTVFSQTGVPGLNIKAPVKLHGVQVGKVEAIGFDPANPRQILVGIAVDKSAPLTTATVARLAYQGITGLSFIELSEADEITAAVPRAADSRIELRPSLLDQLSSASPGLLAGINEATMRFNTLLSDANQQQLSRTLLNLGDASAQLSALAQSLRPVAQRAEGLLQNAGDTLHGFDGLASESTQLAAELRQRLQALDRVGVAADQLRSSTQRLEQALVGLDKPRQQPLLDELGQAARSIDRAAASLDEQPQSLIFGRAGPPPGPGEAGFDANRKGR